MWWGKARALRFTIHSSLNSFFISALRLYALMLFSASLGALSAIVVAC